MRLLPAVLIPTLLVMGLGSLPGAKGEIWPVYLNGLLFGISMLPVIPLCMSFSVEVTFPLNASTSNSVVVLLGQGGTFLISMVGTWVTRQDFTK